MTSETERELVESSGNEKFTEHDKTFQDDDENGADDDNFAEGRQGDGSEKSTSRADQSSVLQSTPVNGSPPTRESHLPSAIKSLPKGDRGIRKSESSIETRQRKSIFSMLSSIAEKSFNSPRRIKQPPPNIDDEILVDAAISENDNSIGSSGSLLETPLTNEHKRLEPQCKCTSCNDAFAVDTFSDRASQMSCSLASLTCSPRPKKRVFGKNQSVDGEYGSKMSLPIGENPSEGKYTRINVGVHRLSKFLHIKVKADRKRSRRSPIKRNQNQFPGHKSFSKRSIRSEINSETSSTAGGAQSFRTFCGDESKSVKEQKLLSKCLRKLASAVTIHNLGNDRGPAVTDDCGEIDGDHFSVSNNSLMFVLLPPKPGDAEFDQLIWGTEGKDGTQSKNRDPALKCVLEEIRDIMLSQGVIMRQASKALDECSNLVRKQSDGIIFAEQLLSVAYESYVCAENELQRLLDGGVFEPQRDRVVLRKITFDLPDFKFPAPQSYFLVLLKSGHRTKSSKLICVTPRQQAIIVEDWNRHTGDKKQTTECVFEFNRPDWVVHIEVYFVCKQRRESLVSFDRFARLMDARAPPSRRIGSNRSVELRKSSFGLLGRATFSKKDILDKRLIYLKNSPTYGPFQSRIKFGGQAFLHSTASHEGYLIVKDFNGRFGSKGQMRTFSARLSDQRLDFFERYDNSCKDAEPRETILLYDIPEKNVEMNSEDCTYFYDFTLKLAESKESWLHLCTNSREDTNTWVTRLRLALSDPCGVDLQFLSPEPNAPQVNTQAVEK